MYNSVYNDVEKATYRRAIAMVSMVAVVDDKRRVQEVLLSATPGTPIADFLDEHEKKSMETLEKEIEEVRSAARDNEEEKEVPKPRISVYHLTQEEAADYFQELLSFTQRNILQVKRTEFRNFWQPCFWVTLSYSRRSYSRPRKVFKLYQKYFSVLPRNYL